MALEKLSPIRDVTRICGVSWIDKKFSIFWVIFSDESLKKNEYVYNSTVEYRTYQGNKLPVTIAFAIW